MDEKPNYEKNYESVFTVWHQLGEEKRQAIMDQVHSQSKIYRINKNRNN